MKKQSYYKLSDSLNGAARTIENLHGYYDLREEMLHTSEMENKPWLISYESYNRYMRYLTLAGGGIVLFLLGLLA